LISKIIIQFKKKTDYCLVLTDEDEDLKTWLCFESEEDVNYWKEQLRWRMNALKLLKLKKDQRKKKKISNVMRSN